MQIKWPRCTVWGVVGFMLVASICIGRGEPPEEQKTTPERAAFIDQLTKEFKVETGGEPSTALMRSEKSILQWSWLRNGFTDGQTYVWSSGGRPQAIGGAFLVTAEKAAYYEFVSVSPQPLICKLKDEVVWTPPAINLDWRAISAAPQPAGTPQGRLTQMRSLARQISGVARMGPPRYPEGSRWELRLLTTPVYRYADGAEGVVDGAIFVMVMGTDPQMLMLLEAQTRKGKTAWMTAFARLSGFELAALQGETELWNSSNIENGHDKTSVWHLSKPIDAMNLFDPATK